MQAERLPFVERDDLQKRTTHITTFEEETYTVEDAINQMGLGIFQIKLMVVAGLSWIADSMEMMLLSILSAELKCNWYLSTIEVALITTAVFTGMMVGAAFFGWVGDYAGRKKGIYLSILWVTTFGILSSQAPFYGWIIVLRFLVGFGIGGNAQAVTIVTELLPSQTRGKAIILLEVFFATGSAFAALLALFTMRSLGWRWLLGFATLPSFLFLILGLWMPESPRYLLTAGRYDDAIKVLIRIAKENNSKVPNGKLIDVDAHEIRGEFWHLFKKEWRRTTIVLLVMWFTVGFAYFGVTLLATEVFQTGVNSCNPLGKHKLVYNCECRRLIPSDYYSYLWVTVAEYPGLFLTIAIIECMGRKNTMTLEYACAGLFFLLMFICTTRTFNVIFMFGVRAFTCGVFQTLFVYTPEIFPTTVRATGLGTCSACARVGAMVTPFVAEVVLSASFYYAIGIYVALLGICALLAVLLPIETQGRSLQDTTEDVASDNENTGYSKLK